jgi:hypothetical protein
MGVFPLGDLQNLRFLEFQHFEYFTILARQKCDLLEDEKSMIQVVA